MAPAKKCHACGSTNTETDTAAGNVVCLNCFAIIEEGILVSEVGFSEGAGGRVHVQGTFVSNFATGIPGFRGRGKEESAANVKKQGEERIDMVAQDLHLDRFSIARPAKRYFNLAVDQRFNRGRKTEYVVASCLYLQCRLTQQPTMLIDFSERLAVNVYELGATYLKLRSILHLIEPMPEVDPAIYSLHFANKLDLAGASPQVGADASRLIRRFRADWMTQGRRPAGVCGACLLIAARMNNYLRTPEEIAQAVKVAPVTIRRRLVEFAQTEMANKTVDEWRKMSDKDLDKVGNEEPPIVKQQRLQKLKEEVRKSQVQRIRRRQEGGILNEGDVGEEDDAAMEEAAIREADGEGPSGEGEEDEVETSRPKKRRKGKGKAKEAESPPDKIQGAIQAAAEEFGDIGDEGEGGDDSNDTLAPIEQAEYMDEMAAARDNPEEVQAERKRDKRAFKRGLKALNADNSDNFDPQLDDSQLEGLAANLDEEVEVGSGTLRAMSKEKLDEIDSALGLDDDFENWDDYDATVQYLGEKLFTEETRLLGLNDIQLRERVQRWITTREPQEVIRELRCVERARAEREEMGKMDAEVEFPDIDDDELEKEYVLDEDEMKMRARIWLNHNAKWLEEDREKQAKRAAYNKAHGVDPNKPKKRKKRNVRQGPFPTAREALDNIASTKKFSSRLNYGVLSSLGLGKDETASLQSFDEKEDDDEKEDEDDKDDEDENDD